jgi:hypothetical protein
MSPDAGQRLCAPDQDAATVNLDRDCRDATNILAQRLARDQRNAPIVKRAGHCRIMHDPLAERALLMRAFVDERIDAPVRGMKDRNLLTASYGQRSRAKRWKLIDGADIEPFTVPGHALTIGRISAKC